jgi:hypothetical protein
MFLGDPAWFWIAALSVVIVYCAIQAFRDFKAKNYAWAAAAAICAVILVTMPIKTHAIKIDLPISR